MSYLVSPDSKAPLINSLSVNLHEYTVVTWKNKSHRERRVEVCLLLPRGSNNFSEG